MTKNSKPIKRQILFFLMSVLLPSTVLLSFGVVLLKQETELNERRLDELRTFAARDLSDSLFQALESSYALIDQEQGRYSASSPRLLVLGRSVDGLVTSARNSVVQTASHPLLEAGFQQFMRETEQERLNGLDPVNLISKYEARLSRTSSPEQSAFLELHVARALENAGLVDVSTEWDLNLLDHPVEITDDYGNPLAYYAADRLLRKESNTGAVLARLKQDLHSANWLTSGGLIFLSDLLSSFDPIGREDSLALAGIKSEHEVASFLDGREALLQRNDVQGPSWFLLPDQPWLIRRLRQEGDEWVTAVLLSELQTRPGTSISRGPSSLASHRTFTGQLAGLVATIDAASLPLGNDNNEFLIAGLILVLGLTLYGGYLLWRDIRRESRLAQLKMQFVASVSHELRTPLTSIRLFAETMLSYSSDKEERDKNLSIISNESERLTRMLNNVLDTSKVEQGEMFYRPKHAEMSEIVDRASDAMAYSFQKEGLELKIETEIIWAHFDPDAIEQALINLLANSIKYASSGKHVSVSCAKNGNNIILKVADDGPGIADEEQRRVFERFYRGTRAVDRQVTGAGLGLALVDHIAIGHGGEVSVESTLGHGATFTITIPIEQS